MFKKDFDSLADFANFAEQWGRDSKIRSHQGTSWYGCEFSEALTLARTGWGEGAAQALALATRLGHTASSMVLQHDPFMATEGIELDIGAYTSGVPECWIDAQPAYRPAQGGVVTLVASFGATSAVSPRQMIARGCAVAAAVAALETAGRSVEVFVANPAVGGGGDSAMARVKVKSAGQPLDLSILSYATGHPSMLRRLGFAFRDYCCNQEGIQVGPRDSYGRSINVPKEDQGDVYAPVLLGTRSEAATMKWIAEVLTEQGIEIGAA